MGLEIESRPSALPHVERVWRSRSAAHAPVPGDAEFFGISFALGTSMPHIPVSRLVGGNAAIPDVTRRSLWLKGSAWHVPDYDNAEAFVRRMVREGVIDLDPVVPAVLVQEEVPLLEIVDRLGYFDQPHLARSLQRYVGRTEGGTRHRNRDGGIMRRVVSGLFISLDGVVQAPNEGQFEFDEEMGAAPARSLDGADTILLGGKTFTEWAGYWPTVTGGADAGFATWIDSSPEYVVSSTLDSVDDWANSTLVRGGDLVAAVTGLKAGEGEDITVAGSSTLVRSLLELDLLDELVLLIHPVVAGEGRRKLFADDPR